MSTFWSKLSQGAVPGAADWTEHLIEAHKDAPSMTPRAFAAHKTRDGRTSYEILAEQIKNDRADITVVDLACGDGYLAQFLLPRLGAGAKLIGIDMSEAELDVARREVKDPRGSFCCAKAEKLPLPDRSVDVVLSHMALMLMAPLEPVIAELARVLKKSGRFAAITGNADVKAGVEAEIDALVFDFVARRYPKIREVKVRDQRLNSREGLLELFRPELGFGEPIDLGEFELQAAVLPEGLWDYMKDMYFVGMLPASEKEELRALLVEFASSNAGSDGKLRFEIPMRGFSAQKRELAP